MSSDRIFKYYINARFHDLLSTEGYFPLLVPPSSSPEHSSRCCVSMLIHRLVTAVARITSRKFPENSSVVKWTQHLLLLRSRSTSWQGYKERKRYRDKGGGLFLEWTCQTILKSLCRLFVEKSASHLCHLTWEVLKGLREYLNEYCDTCHPDSVVSLYSILKINRIDLQ